MPSIIADHSAYRGRFAPSPTGPLHLGSLTAALGSWLMARYRGGEWLLRIEDLDPPRELPGMAQEQIRVLTAFGLIPDRPVAWQSTRVDLYAESLGRLIDHGMAYKCRCSRTDLSASSGIHRRCVDHPSGLQPAWRLRVPARTLEFEDALRGRSVQDLGAEVGDVVLKRADGCWSYQLAVVVDDALQGITEVVRGADLIDSTPRQIFLQQVLGYATPAYAHLPVIREFDGLKLSKSLRSTALDPADPLPALRLAYGWLGQDSRELEGSANSEQALRRALTAFQPERIPAKDHFLPLE